MDIFVLSAAASDLYQQAWDSTNGWHDWYRLGVNWTSYVPTVVSWGENRLDTFVVDPKTKELYHTYWDGTAWQPASSTSNFENLGGYCTSRPVAVSWSSGRIDVFVRGGGAGLWHLSYSQNIRSNWTSISGNTSILAEPEAVSWGQNRIDVLAWGTDESFLHKSYDGATNKWTPAEGFETLGQGLGGSPKGVSDAVGSLQVFSFSKTSELQHVSWNETVGDWSPAGGRFETLGVAPT
jgi:hypothetical protein